MSSFVIGMNSFFEVLADQQIWRINEWRLNERGPVLYTFGHPQPVKVDEKR